LGCDHINALYKFTITYLLTYLHTHDGSLPFVARTSKAMFRPTRTKLIPSTRMLVPADNKTVAAILGESTKHCQNGNGFSVCCDWILLWRACVSQVVRSKTAAGLTAALRRLSQISSTAGAAEHFITPLPAALCTRCGYVMADLGRPASTALQ